MSALEQIKSESQTMFNKIINQLTIQNLFLYIIEGLAVAIAAYLIPNRRTKFDEILLIGLIASATFFILDLFSAKVGEASRFGAGFGIGYNLLKLSPALL